MNMCKSQKDMSFQELMNADCSALGNEIDVLKTINDLLPQIIAYKKSFNEKLADRLSKLGEEGRKQLELVWNNPNDQSLTMTDGKALELYCSFFEFFGYPIQIPRLIRQMSLVYLISVFESYLERVISMIFSASPETLKSEKTLTYKEILGYTTMDDLINNLKYRDIKSLMREDIEKILNTFSKRFNLPGFKPETSDWRRLKESFYRRHVTIHNNAFQDTTYKIKTRYRGPQKDLHVEKQYLAKRFDTFQRCSEVIRDSVNAKFGTEKAKSNIVQYDFIPF